MSCGVALVGGPAVAVAFAAGRPSLTTTTGPTTTTPTTTTTTTTGTTTTTTTTSSTDAASDRAALLDYRTYLQALVADTQLGVQRDDAFTAKVKQRCSGALTPISTLASGHLSTTVLSELGEEIGGDLALAFLSEADKPFAQLSAELAALPWTEAPPPEAAHGLLTAETAVLGLTTSSLCSDARSVTLHPKVEPAGTQSWLGPYVSDSSALKQQLTQFLSVLSRFANGGESKLIATIDHLVAKFAAASASVEKTDAAAVLTALGLPG